MALLAVLRHLALFPALWLDSGIALALKQARAGLRDLSQDTRPQQGLSGTIGINALLILH